MPELKVTMAACLAIVLNGVLNAAPVMAYHANPWAGDDDTVNAQYHEVNQTSSIDTPGEDEMNGAMTRSAFGKLGGSASADAGQSGNGGQGAGAQGAGGHGAGGHGAGGQGAGGQGAGRGGGQGGGHGHGKH